MTTPAAPADGTPAELAALLDELERFGRDHDAAHADAGRGPRMLNITRDTGQFLAVLVRAVAARRVLEIGTSNGYSTLWLASAARAVAGHVTTVEPAPEKVALAAVNFRRAGLASSITQLRADGASALAGCADGSIDLLFLDAVRQHYLAWWPDLRRVLRPGGLLVVDNALSHAAELAPLVAMVEGDGAFHTSLVPVGKGEFLAVKG